MPRQNEVSVWVSEFTKGTLPPVCVKSGKPAGSKLKFRFGEFTYGGGRAFLSLFFGVFAFLGGPQADGNLPMTKRWRNTLLTFRWAALIAFPAALFATFAAAAATSLPIVAVGGALFAVYALSHLAYAGLRPKGTVHRDLNGSWIDLRGVHPNFVAAVRVMEADELMHRGISPDGFWYWDGSHWLPTTSADGKWRWDGLKWRASVPAPK